MTTIINSPREDSGNGVLIGVVIVILLAILFFFFGLPYLRGGAAPASDSATGSINVDVPGVGSGSAGGTATGDGQ